MAKGPAKAPRTTAPAAGGSIDPRAPGVVLEYVGGRVRRYVPGRSLEGIDLERIAYRRAADATRASRSRLVVPGAERPQPTRPAPASAAAIEAIADELVATGSFIRVTKPDQPASPATKPEA